MGLSGLLVCFLLRDGTCRNVVYQRVTAYFSTPKIHRQPVSPVPLYLLITFALSWLFWLPIFFVGGLQQVYYYAIGLMWMPGLSALLTLRILKQPLTIIGWQWPDFSYLQKAYWIPLAYITGAYGLLWAFGLGIFPNPHMIRFWAENYAWGPSNYSGLILWHGLLTATIGVLSCCVNTLGEEIGWRGLLVPYLYQKFSYVKTALLSGLCWAGWHMPILFFADYNNGPSAPLWLGAGCFTVLTVGLSFGYTWLRLKSRSLWPCVLFHSAHNMFIQGLFSPLTKNTTDTAYWSDEFGLLLPCLSVLTGYYFWRRRRELQTGSALN